jgi:hypothetical protein
MGRFKLRKFITRIEREASRITADIDKTATRAEEGKLFGSSTYGRYAANITGATTTAKLIRRGRNGEVINPNDVRDDARVMRPGIAYKNAAESVNGEMEAEAQREADAQEAARSQVRFAEARRARLQAEVRVRRAGRSDRPSSKGGTLLTGALGLIDRLYPDQAAKSKLGQ